MDPGEQEQQALEQAQIKALARIDREVRTHEAAHAAAGGAIAGAPSFQFTRGPDGRLYATGGEVGIETGGVPGDPQATIDKARTIIQAALAPANPSPQDLRVAAQAQALLVEAQSQLALQEVQAQTQGREAAAATEGESGEASPQDPDAAAREREAAEARQERIREGRAELAEQHRAMTERLNEVSKRLIDAGVIEILEPEGVFLDLLV